MNFSVLLSVYKNEDPKHLNQALLSIWDGQKLKPSEIILIEDGPLNEHLYKVLDYWSNKIPKVFKRITLPFNQGLGRALNIGLSHCNHNWVFRMDTDDICLPDRFEKQISFLNQNPTIDILSGQVIEFDTMLDNVIGYKRVPLTHKEIVRFSKTRNPFNHMAIAYKKSVIESVGGYQHHAYMEDYNLWLRVLAAGHKSANLNDTLVKVRAGTEMVARRSGKQYIKSEWQLFKLKKYLHCQSTPTAFSTFVVRSVPRLLPNKVLTKVYSILRKG